MAAFPDQKKVRRALEDLELLVTVDPHMSSTARLSDYVIAPKIALECLATTMANEWFGLFGPGWGFDEPYAQCSEPVIEPPEGSDLVEDWEVPFGIAKRLGLKIAVKDLARMPPEAGENGGTLLDTSRNPTSAELWAMVTRSAPVPFEVIRETAQRGRVFPQPAPVVARRPDDWTGRLDIGNATMMDELSQLAAHGSDEAGCYPGYGYRVISRRMRDVMNSCWHEAPTIRWRTPSNPAYMNPLDIDQEGLTPGDIIRIDSRRAHILAVVQAEPGVRRGCISMAHAWGGVSPEEADEINDGANTRRLTADDEDFDRYSGIPRMSGIPVRISRFAAPETQRASN
jgi:anaerobic selenocysteine-containing dehydrogenase